MAPARLLPLLLLTLCRAAAAQNPRSPLTHETLWRLKAVGGPVASPDGRQVVVPVTEPAYDEKDEVADLWLVPGDGSAPPRRLTTAKGSESGAAWSPDGQKLVFQGKRDGDDAAQLYLLDLAGGEARRLTTRTLGARGARFSPDGKWLLFQGAVHRGAADEAAHRRRDDELKQRKSKVRSYDGFPVRRWDRWIDDTQTHVFVLPVDGSQPPRDLLAGTQLVAGAGFRGAGGEGAGDSLQPVWAPDGQSIVFTASTNADVTAYAEPTTHLFQVPVAGGEPRPLTTGDVSHGNPLFAPDGTHLACTQNAGKGVIYALDRLAVGAWPWTGSAAPVAPAFDRAVAECAWLPDSKTLLFSAEDAGHLRVWSVPSTGGEPRVAVDAPHGVWLSLCVPERAASPVLFASWESAVHPAETFRVDLPGGKQTRLSAFNVAAAAAIDWQPLREMWCTTPKGRKLHSFLALPPGFDERRRYPLLVLIHGGHANMWRDSITRRWNYHLLAQPGYCLLLTDYVGSTGYGEQFTRDILGDPLRGPAEDVNQAADAALALHKFLDESRQAAAGASYGGHLANWLEATTTRYKCLISHAGLASLYGQWATSDSIYHRELMMGGPFWEKSAAWLDQSPTTYAKHMKTPLLLSVGENDFRVPLNNTLEMWSVLQRQRVPSRLLVWPEENHWILKGENSREFYREVHAWLAKWLGA